MPFLYLVNRHDWGGTNKQEKNKGELNYETRIICRTTKH